MTAAIGAADATAPLIPGEAIASCALNDSPAPRRNNNDRKED
jgi:hypothetical protein